MFHSLIKFHTRPIFFGKVRSRFTRIDTELKQYARKKCSASLRFSTRKIISYVFHMKICPGFNSKCANGHAQKIR